MFWNKNAVSTGIILGLLLPFLGFWLIKGFFELFTYFELFNPNGFSASWRARTIALLAICANIIPFNLYRKRRFDDSMRGLIFPTIFFVAIWVYQFRADIFQNM